MATILETCIESLQGVPNNFRRQLDQLRVLDRISTELYGEISTKENDYIVQIKRRLREYGKMAKQSSRAGLIEDPALQEEIHRKRQELRDLKEEKNVILDQTTIMINAYLEKLQEDLKYFEEVLTQQGEFQLQGDPRAGDQVAMQINPYEHLWILGRVVQFHPESASYEVVDEDDGEKSFFLPEQQVIFLSTEKSKLFDVGDQILAVYPETTSLYPAVITSIPKQSYTSGISEFDMNLDNDNETLNDGGVVTVQFADDADETGRTPHRTILRKYVLKIPENY